MIRTTPPPPLDVASVLPELAALRRTAVRLHPRHDSGVTADQSSLGGPIRWPVDVPWPECELPHEHFEGTGGPQPDPGTRYIPVLQLLRSDVPELPFRDDTEVFHLLWCPNDHSATYSVVCRAYWWRRETLRGADSPPAPTTMLDGYAPGSCSLHPERVVEYPGIEDLPEDIRAQVDALRGTDECGRREPTYQWRLSTAPGSKVGGHPHWFQEPEWPTCSDGHRMEHLLTVSDHEFDGGTWHRWLPVEESGTWDGPTDRRLRIQAPADLRLGMASIYVFLCQVCPDGPIETVYQR